MAPKLTRMTEGGATVAGARRKDGGKLRESFTTGMAEATVPHRSSGGSEGMRSRWVQWVQGPEAIAPDDQFPGQEILHRTTSRVKFNRTVIVGSELAN